MQDNLIMLENEFINKLNKVTKKNKITKPSIKETIFGLLITGIVVIVIQILG